MASITISILADALKAQKAIKDTTDDLEGLSGTAEKASGGIGGSFKRIGETAAGFMTAQAIPAVMGFGKEMINLGGTLNAQAAKAKVVFGDQLGAVQQWAEGSAKAMGVSKAEAVDLATGMADLYKPMGFTTEQASKMATEMTGLSSTLSKWSGGTRSAAEVSDIITKAMLGEREGLKELGVSISEADVQARLAATGQDKLTGAALEQAKALATQGLIMEKSADAQRAVAEGAFSAGDAQLELSSKMAELRNTVALRVQPVFLAFTKLLADTVVPALETIGSWVAEHIVPALASFGGFLTGTVLPALSAFGSWVATHKEYVITFAAALGVVGTAVLVSLVPAFIAWAAASLAAAAGTVAAFAPIAAAVAVLAALSAAVVYAYQNVGWFRTAVDAVAAAFSWLWTNAIQPLVGFLVTNFVPTIVAVAGAVIGGFQSLWGVVGPIVGLIIDIIGKWIAVHVAIAQKVAEVVGWVVARFVDLWNGVQPIVTFLVAAIWSWWAAVAGAVAAIFGVLGTIAGFVGGVVSRVASIGSGLFSWVAGTVSGVYDTVAGPFNAIVGFVAGLPGRIGDAARGMFDGISNAFKGAINFVIRGWNSLRFSIPSFDVGPVHWDGFSLGVPSIAELATGGVVTRPILSLVGEAGPEAVIPLRDLRGLGTTIVVNVTHTGLAVDSPQVGRDVVAALRAYEARNGRVVA